MSKIEEMRSRGRQIRAGESEPSTSARLRRKSASGSLVHAPPTAPGERPQIPIFPHANTSKFTQERVDIILEALSRGNYRTVACSLADVADNTFWRWMNRGEAEGEGPHYEFLLAVLKAEAQSESDIVGHVVSAVPDDWRAGIEILQRRHPDRWSKRTQNEVSGPGGGPVELRVVYEDEEVQDVDPDDIVEAEVV